MLHQFIVDPQQLLKGVGGDLHECNSVTGAAGTAFLENSIGIHAGPIPISQPRLVLQVAYTLLPRFELLYKPIEIESRPAIDKYNNRLYIR